MICCYGQLTNVGLTQCSFHAGWLTVFLSLRTQFEMFLSCEMQPSSLIQLSTPRKGHSPFNSKENWYFV